MGGGGGRAFILGRGSGRGGWRNKVTVGLCGARAAPGGSCPSPPPSRSSIMSREGKEWW